MSHNDEVLILATLSFMFAFLAFVLGVWATIPYSIPPVVLGGYIMGRSLRILTTGR